MLAFHENGQLEKNFALQEHLPCERIRTRKCLCIKWVHSSYQGRTRKTQRHTTPNLKGQFYHIVFENTYDPLALINSGLNIAEVSQQPCNLFGYTGKEILTLNAGLLFPSGAVNRIFSLSIII